MIFYRLYSTQVAPVLANLKAHPELADFKGVGFQVLFKNLANDPATQLADMKAFIEQAKADHREVIPGFRCMENKAIRGYLDVARWDRNAAYLRTMVEGLAPPFGSQVAFDIEDYEAGTERATSLVQQTEAMRPFLDAIAETGIVPCVYPANIIDYCTQAIGDSAPFVEFWTETSFDLPLRARTGKENYNASALPLFRVREAFRHRWPGCLIRHGSYDDLLRNWGAPMRASIADYGGVDPWLFDILRVDDLKIGTPEWVSGMSLSAVNDLKHAWRFPQYSRGLDVVSLPGGVKMTAPIFSTPPARADLRSSLGAVITPGTALLAGNVLPKLGDLSVFVELVLPLEGDGPLFGASQANAEGWQVSYDGATDQIVLEMRVKTVPGTVWRKVVMEHPSRGSSIRICIVLDDGDWKCSGEGFTGPVVPVGPGAGHLWLGAGTFLDGSRRTRTFNGSLVFALVDVWHRALSDLEWSKVLVSTYPRVG